MGRKPKTLAIDTAPECPDELRYLLGWFHQLNGARGSNGFGWNPVGYHEIWAWAQLTGIAPVPWEVRVLARLDHIWLAAMAKKDATKTP